MSNLTAAFIVQLAPISFGILFVAAMRSLKLREEKIVIRHSSISRGFPSENAPFKPAGEPTALRREVFERMARDELVVGGFMGRQAESRGIEELAANKLGLVDVERLPEFEARLSTLGNERLTLFVREKNELLARMLTFKYPSGLLLFYLADYALELAG